MFVMTGVSSDDRVVTSLALTYDQVHALYAVLLQRRTTASPDSGPDVLAPQLRSLADFLYPEPVAVDR